MAEYLNKELFLQSMGLLGDETKYGNRDGEHQNRSYSTWMGYEIMDSVDDSIVEEDIVSVVRCKDCQFFDKRGYEEDNRQQAMPELDFGWCSVLYRIEQACNFCSSGERKDNEREAD